MEGCKIHRILKVLLIIVEYRNFALLFSKKFDFILCSIDVMIVEGLYFLSLCNLYYLFQLLFLIFFIKIYECNLMLVSLIS